MKRAIILITILLASLLVYGCGPKVNYDEFAKCVTDVGAVMYGSSLCPHCTNQKKAFGNSFRFIKYVECNGNMPGGEPEKCQEENVQYLPTWKFSDGSELVGELEFPVLAAKTKCALP